MSVLYTPSIENFPNDSNPRLQKSADIVLAASLVPEEEYYTVTTPRNFANSGVGKTESP